MGERRHGSNLDDFAKLASWPTPTAALATKGVRSEQGAIMEAMRSHGPDLAAMVALASWPTPTVNDSKGDYTYGSGDHERICLKLSGTAKLAGWGTPTSTEAWGTPERRLERMQELQDRGFNPGRSVTQLSHQARLASWATPAARDWRDGRASQETMERNARPLNEQAVQLASWSTPLASDGDKADATLPVVEARALAGKQLSTAMQARLVGSGQTQSGSSVATGSGGQLNPNTSRWLMGLPKKWDVVAPRQERSGRSRRAKSRASVESKDTETPSSPR